MAKSRKKFRGQKTQKLKSSKGKHSETNCNYRKTRWIDFNDGSPWEVSINDQNAMKMDISLQKNQSSFFFVKTFLEKPLFIGFPSKNVPSTKLVWKLLNLHWKAIRVDWKNVGIIFLQKEIRERQFCSWKNFVKWFHGRKMRWKWFHRKGSSTFSISVMEMLSEPILRKWNPGKKIQRKTDNGSQL